MEQPRTLGQSNFTARVFVAWIKKEVKWPRPVYTADRNKIISQVYMRIKSGIHSK